MKVKNIVFSGAMASILMMGAAIAADKTDLTFNGKYSLGDGTSSSVSNEPVAANYGYTYTKSDGGTKTTASSDEAPAQTDFTYQNKDGDTKSLADGTPTIDNYAGTSKAGTTGYEVVSTTQDVKAGATISKANYSYTGGDGEPAVLGESANNMTDTVTLDSTYAAAKEITITNGNADSFSGENYTWTNPDTGSVFHLNAAGDKFLDKDNNPQTPDAGSAAEAAFNAMKSAFTTDSGNVDSAKTTTGNQWTIEQENFAKAGEVYSADSTTIGNLDTRWATVGTATTAYSTAQGKQTEAQDKLTTDHGLWSDASTLYNAPIYGTIDGEINAALAEGGAINAAIAGETTRAQGVEGDLATLKTTEKSNLVGAINENTDAITTLDGKVGNTNAMVLELQSAGNNTDKNLAFETASVSDHLKALANTIGNRNALNGDYVSNADVATNLQSLNNGVEVNTDAIDAEALARAAADTTLQNNIDAEASRAQGEEAAIRSEFAAADELTLSSAKAFANAGNELTLSKANAYTDAKVDTLEKNVSGGIAAATALSAVEVSNVKRGEMSVGGGYGYYNGQSAGAFGMAMGLSDNWSVNAGAGIASGDKTQVSFRAGTNYKFKLF